MKSEVITAIDDVAATIKEYRTETAAELKELRERIETAESISDRPSMGSGGDFSAAQREYKGVFLDYIRHTGDKVYENRCAEANHELAKKDVAIGSGAAGGFALPEQVSAQIEQRLKAQNPFRSIVRVEKCSTNDFKCLVSMGDASAGWSAETGTRSATDAPTLRERAPGMYELYAVPTASNWSLADMSFNVEQWLVDEISAEWASLEATGIIAGTGSTQLTGILNTTPTLANDDGTGISPEALRDAATIEYVPLSGSSSPLAFDMDSLILLVAQMNERYLADAENCAWVMHRATAASVRRMKDENGRYIWQESSILGAPATLLGYPVITCSAMPLASAGNYFVLFGNFKRGYILAERESIQLTANPYSVPGVTSFYVRKRIGGTVLLNDAIKCLKHSVS